LHSDDHQEPAARLENRDVLDAFTIGFGSTARFSEVADKLPALSVAS
jgi:hypothetical protein